MWWSYFCNGTVRLQSWKLWQTINLLTAINFWWFMVNHKSALSMTLILGLDFPPPSILQSICKHSFSTDSNWWWVQIQFNPFFAPTHERVFLFSEWFWIEGLYFWRDLPSWNKLNLLCLFSFEYNLLQKLISNDLGHKMAQGTGQDILTYLWVRVLEMAHSRHLIQN